MSKQCKFILLLAVAALASACEQNITLDLGGYSQKLVIHSELQAGEKPRVYLMQSVQYFGDVSGFDYRRNFITGAEVIIKDGAKTHILTPIKGYAVQNIFGNGYSYQDSLLLDFYEGNWLVEPGKTYQLIARYGEQEVAATTTVPLPLQIKKAFFVTQNDTDGGEIKKEYRVRATVNDPIEPGNTYRLSYSFSGWQYNTFQSLDYMPGLLLRQYYAFQNEFGQWDTIYEYIQDSTFITETVVSDRFETDDKSNGGVLSVRANFHVDPMLQGSGLSIPIQVRLHHVAPEMKDYYDSLDDQLDNQNNPFAEPVLVKSNVTGGLGLFSSFAVSEPMDINAKLE